MSFTSALQPLFPKRTFSVSDITIIICVRLCPENSWLVSRISNYSSFLEPCPNILVVDDGSEVSFAGQLMRICQRKGYQYASTRSKLPFSLSQSRNFGFSIADTDLLFFTDPDFLYEKSVFLKLLNIVNSLDYGFNSFSRVTFPAYHFSRQSTEYIENQNDFTLIEQFLVKAGFYGIYKDESLFEYVSPYSNNFICHRNYFDLVGGYSTEFKGHGSEDFEFIIRANVLQGQLPLPENIDSDIYEYSLHDDKNSRYRGFRRLAELETMASELHGLKSFHLWHPRKAAPGWYEDSDSSRTTFNKVVQKYIDKPLKILEIDYLERKKFALCIVSDESHLGLFLPLRLNGYKLEVLYDKSEQAVVLTNIDKNKYARVFVFNPYTEKKFEQVIQHARKNPRIKLTVIERGALPNSIYYSGDMAYQDQDFTRLTIDSLKAFYREQKADDDTTPELNKILNNLRSGQFTLELNEDYGKTEKSLIRYINCFEGNIIFIPLQLPYDTAVTLFNKDYPTYDYFLTSLASSISHNKDTLFLIKPHPLLKKEYYPELLSIKAKNIRILEENENIHAVIDQVDGVLLYNSGVGLLSLFHLKPVFHLGNVFYGANGHFTTRVNHPDMAVKALKQRPLLTFDQKDLLFYLFWLIRYKYSFFNAVDEYRDLENKKSHAYHNIQVAIFNSEEQNFTLGGKDYLYKDSYAAKRIGLKQGDDKRRFVKHLGNQTNTWQFLGAQAFMIVMSPFLSQFNRSMLRENPRRFFRTVKHPFSVWVGNKLGLR